ncbi:MAG: serine/threonine-protein kinase, partial [Actinobacteria bacterium]|nr:serine/threonine-protein kinase [Actinomycetota bacterium]
MATDNPPQAGTDQREGQRLGNYLVEARIGRGGMGVVFRARHVVTGDTVALKLMAPDLADNLTFRERFVREAEAGPTVIHPNIVRVFESGESDGELFIAMELIEGTDLKALIREEGQLDPKRALAILRQAAGALDAAHESGMVHRDVKPQNILVIPRDSSEGTDRVYLTDFGLVRPVASETSASRTGQVFGSVPYMAPELIEGIPADGRADVYALACVVYECLTGSVPFERDNEVSTVWAHIHEDPPLMTDTRRDLPGGLNDVVFKAMSKHPDDRYLTCGEFVAELELGLGRKLSALKYSHVRPLVARIPRRKTEREVWAPNYFPELSRVRAASRERFDWRKAAALLAAVVLLSSVHVGRDGGISQAVADVADAADSVVDSAVEAVVDPEPRRDQANDEVAEKGRGLTGAAAEPISPSDRKKLKALLRADDRTRSAGVNDPAAGSGGLPEQPKIAWAWEIPSSTWVAEETNIWVMDSDGSNQIRLTATAVREYWPSWSPDGRYIAYVRISEVREQDIWIMDADGGNQRDLGLCPGDADCGKLAWSPDGRRVAFAQGTDLFVADLATGTRELLVSGRLEVGAPPEGFMGSTPNPGPTWSPNGRSLAFTCGSSLCIVPADGGEPRVAVQGQSEDFTDPEWSPTGPWLAFGSTQNNSI